MRPVPQLITLLRADPSVSDLVGQRIYADNPPQDDDLPIVVLAITSTNARAALDNCQIRLYSARLKVDIVCSTRSAAEAARSHLLMAATNEAIGVAKNTSSITQELRND
jgi:hypothetical protein